MHHQSKQHPDDMRLCFEFEDGPNCFTEAVNRAWDECPPPDGWRFLVCDEKSKYFIDTPAAT